MLRGFCCLPISLTSLQRAKEQRVAPILEMRKLRPQEVTGLCVPLHPRVVRFFKRVLLPSAGGIWGIKPFTVTFYELPALNMPFYEIAKSAHGIRVKQARAERRGPFRGLISPQLPRAQGAEEEAPFESPQGVFQDFFFARPGSQNPRLLVGSERLRLLVWRAAQGQGHLRVRPFPDHSHVQQPQQPGPGACTACTTCAEAGSLV